MLQQQQLQQYYGMVAQQQSQAMAAATRASVEATSAVEATILTGGGGAFQLMHTKPGGGTSAPLGTAAWGAQQTNHPQATSSATTTTMTKHPTTPWQELQPASHEVAYADLHDIQHLVEEARGGAEQLIPLLATVAEEEGSDTYDVESLFRIGRWGEELVATVLRRLRYLPQDGREILHVQWVNEVAESGLSYDIVVDLKEEGEVGGVSSAYIEVKSTSSGSKEVAIFSMRELMFASQKGRDYHLYRVYHAGRSSCRLSHLQDLGRYLQSPGVRLMLLL